MKQVLQLFRADAVMEPEYSAASVGGGGWWSSDAFSASDAYYLLMYSSNSYMRSYSDNKHYGFSVRCLKD